MNITEQIAQLEQRISELEARLPKHSVPAAMMIELEELEEQLEDLKARSTRDDD
jgi:hypothetical protein